MLNTKSQFHWNSLYRAHRTFIHLQRQVKYTNVVHLSFLLGSPASHKDVLCHSSPRHPCEALCYREAMSATPTWTFKGTFILILWFVIRISFLDVFHAFISSNVLHLHSRTWQDFLFYFVIAFVPAKQGWLERAKIRNARQHSHGRALLLPQ